MPAFSGVDYLDFDSLLNDEELLARATARQFVEEFLLPVIVKHNRESTFPLDLVPRLADLGFFGANLEGYGCAGMSNVAYGLVMQELERGDSGLRSFVSVQSALVMFPIYTYGSSESKRQVAAAPAKRQSARLFRAYRAAIWLQPRRHAHARRAPRQPLCPERRKDVDHQRLHRRRRPGVGQVRGRRKDSRLPCGKGHERFHGAGHSRQTFSARFHHVRPGVQRLRNSRGKCAAGRCRTQRPAELPDAGALRHRLGRHRRGHGLL